MDVSAIIIGGITGFISAFFGIGGSSIDTPLLRTFLDFPPYLALGTPLPLTIITVASAFFVYSRKHLVNFRVVGYSLLGGIPAIIAGSYLSSHIPGKFLMLLTAIVLFLVGIDFIYKRFSEEKNKKPALEKSFPSPYYITGVAVLIGTLSGVLANGGGIFFVPAYMMLFGMKMKESIATSLLTVAAMAVPASIVHYDLGHIDLMTSAALGIGIIPMAYMGAKMDVHTDSKTVQFLFGLLLLVFSIYFFISQL